MLLARHGADLGGSLFTWDASIFEVAIRNKDAQVVQYLLRQFYKSNKAAPLKKLIDLCTECSASKCAEFIQRTDFEQKEMSDSNFCACMWYLKWYVYVNGWDPWPPVREIYVKYRIAQNALVATPWSRGPELETLIHAAVHQQPPTLQMLCMTTIVIRLQRSQERIARLLLPELITSELIHASRKSVPVDEYTVQEGKKIVKLPLALKRLFADYK
jgi:hypothetical protein